jgi:RimJ/RimL family protein N-acetyltransferase
LRNRSNCISSEVFLHGFALILAYLLEGLDGSMRKSINLTDSNILMLKTTRLQLRSFSASDATALHGFMSNQLAMRHTYVAPSLEACTARLNTYEDMRSTLGFAPWVIETQSRSEIICWVV